MLGMGGSVICIVGGKNDGEMWEIDLGVGELMLVSEEVVDVDGSDVHEVIVDGLLVLCGSEVLDPDGDDKNVSSASVKSGEPGKIGDKLL